jgi:ABC-type amino acid transport substrate-binding protein
MKRHEIVLFCVLAAAVAAGVAMMPRLFTTSQPGFASAESDTRMKKIIAKGEIRCSYLVYSPYFRKDPNTGQMSGIFFDIMEEVGKRSSLKIAWVEEVGYETIFAGLESGKHDVFCAGLWPNATRARVGSFSVPVFYSVVKAWGRADESRFGNLVGVDSSNVRIATIDGAMEDIIAKADFPQASRESLPQQSPFSQNLLNITSKKADVTFAEPGTVREFLAQNRDSLKELAPDRPLRVFGNVLVLPQREPQLKEFLDVSLLELLYSGAIDRILQKYETGKGTFPRVALPYNPETAVLK